MIELVPAEYDDVAFLSLAQRIINGAIAELRMREVFLVHIDNWFDHKWLGWRSTNQRLLWRDRKGGEELRVPLFTPNRVRSERHFVWDEKLPAWVATGLSRPLHVRQPGRPWLAQPLDRFSKSAAFIWYSGNTTTNTGGSLLLYLSGAEGYSWYASFRKGEEWDIDEGFRVARRELLSFEKRGQQLELAQA